MTRVLLIVDHPQRDLAGMVLTAVELHRRGIFPYLVSMHYMRQAIRNLAPEAVLMPFCREANAHFIKSLTRTNIKVFVLDTEGGIVSSLPNYAATIPLDSDVRSNIEAFFCWGEQTANYLTEQGLFREEQIRVTGHPRFDFYFPPYKQAMKERWSSPHENRKTIVIATTFTLVNPRFTDIDKEMSILQQAGVDRGLIERRIAVESAALQTFLAITQRLSNEFSDLQWVLRPHPFEGDSIYRQHVTNTNVTIERNGEIRQSLSSALALVHHASTTGLEAALLGIPVFETAWLERWAELPAVHAAGMQCPNEDMLFSLIQQLVEHGPWKADIGGTERSVIESWIGPLDGLAATRLAQSMSERLRGSLEPVNIMALNNYFHQDRSLKLKTQSTKKLIGTLLRRLLKLPDSYSFRQRKVITRKFDRYNGAKSFGMEEIRDWLPISGGPGLNVLIADNCNELPVKDTSFPLWKIYQNNETSYCRFS